MRRNHKIRPSSLEENYDRVYINRPDLPEGQIVNTVAKTIYINMPITPRRTDRAGKRRRG